MLEKEAEKMILDHSEAVAEEVKIQQKMRKAVVEEELEDEEVLQTKIVTQKC